MATVRSSRSEVLLELRGGVSGSQLPFPIVLGVGDSPVNYLGSWYVSVLLIVSRVA